jgi:hypothetical protein
LSAVAISREPTFRRRQKVVADVDLPGVPRGTPGRVMYVAGMTWFRCRVAFDNGEEISGLDDRHLVSEKDWQEREQEERRAARLAEQQRRAEELRSRVLAEPATH